MSNNSFKKKKKDVQLLTSSIEKLLIASQL